MSKWRPRSFRVGKQKWELVAGKWQPVLREEHVVKEIVERLWYGARIKVWRVRERIPGMGAPSVAGIPDLFGWIPATGKAVFLEVKRPGGARRAAQERFITEAQSGGCIAGFVDSWQAVVDLFGNYGIKLPI